MLIVKILLILGATVALLGVGVFAFLWAAMKFCQDAGMDLTDDEEK